MVTVFSLSVRTYVGAPPITRNVRSNAANTLGSVLSRIGITTRNRLNASHATNSTVFTPPTTGPSPKSYCNHSPGSVTHGRCTRRFPVRHDVFTAATARLVDRSDPSNPIEASTSWTLSARTLPFVFSTSSSTFGRNSSMTRGLRAAAPTGRPASRAATCAATV